MSTILKDLSAVVEANLGRCPTCMRRSLVAAVAAWAGFGLVLPVRPDSVVLGLMGLPAIGLTALWMLHVGAYSARTVARARNGQSQPPHRGMVGVAPVDRRGALGVLLRAAGGGVAVSVPMVLWPSDGFAFCGQCSKNDDCGVGYVCKDTAPVNSGKTCMECVKS